MSATQPESTAFSAIKLERRTLPKQGRAQERIEAIVEATEKLLEQGRPQDITTSAVATYAQVPVGSVYRYFPNIHAIYGFIYDQMNQEFQAILTEASAVRSEGWRDELRIALSALSSLFEAKPSYRAIFLLALTASELASLREHWNAELASHFSSGWSEGEDGFSADNSEAVAAVVVEIYNAIQSRIVRNWEQAEVRETLSRELILAIESYLERYLQ